MARRLRPARRLPCLPEAPCLSRAYLAQATRGLLSRAGVGSRRLRGDPDPPQDAESCSLVRALLSFYLNTVFRSYHGKAAELRALKALSTLANNFLVIVSQLQPGVSGRSWGPWETARLRGLGLWAGPDFDSTRGRRGLQGKSPAVLGSSPAQGSTSQKGFRGPAPEMDDHPTWRESEAAPPHVRVQPWLPEAVGAALPRGLGNPSAITRKEWEGACLCPSPTVGTTLCFCYPTGTQGVLQPGERTPALPAVPGGVQTGNRAGSWGPASMVPGDATQVPPPGWPQGPIFPRISANVA